MPIRADRAHAQGITGQGIRIGFLDGAPRPDLDGYDVYQGRYVYTRRDDLTTPRIASGADTDHGHRVAMTIVGRARGDFYGGVAPGATLEWLRYCAIVESNTSPNGVELCGGFTLQTYEWLRSRGITIVNHSFGGQTRFWENQFGEIVRDMRPVVLPALEGDMLLLHGGGNGQEQSINMFAGVPYYHREFIGNILAVVGVNLDAQGNVSGIAASHCMVTAEWCLAAPYVIPSAGPNNTASWVTGTSHSVAIVSGVAALVNSAYPWMRGRNLSTVLRTTATDIGDPGVDEVYGWGLVNAERAVRGPMQFLDEFVANVDREGSWTFHHDIRGPGSLTVRGVGQLRLAGNNSYAGLTDIQGGHLGLSGRIAGDVRNGGTFSSFGGRIGGAYTALPGSTTAIEVGRGLEVGGAANLDGTLRLLAPTNPQYQVRDTERVLWAGVINGRFAGVTVGSGFFYSVSGLQYTNTEVLASLVRQSAAAAAKAQGERGAVVAGAARMDALLDWLETGVGNAALREAAYSIAAAPDEAAARTSLASLAGEVHGTTRAIAIEHAQGDAQIVADRAFDARRAGDEPQGWFQVYGRRGTLRSDDYADADLNGHGAIVGGDLAIAEDVRLGGALSKSRGSGDLDDLAGEAKTRRTGLAGYAIAQSGSTYVSAAVGLDRLSVETERTLDLGAQGRQSVRVDRRDRVTHLRLEVGHEVAPGFVPYVGYGVLRHRQGAFAEQGAGGLGLSARADTHVATYGEAGLRIDLSGTDGSAWRGFVGGRFALSGRNPAFEATFAGAPAVTFTVDGQRLPSSVYRAGLGYWSPERDGWQWYAEGVVEGTRDGLRDARIGLGVRWSF